jgi:hypothetical protein
MGNKEGEAIGRKTGLHLCSLLLVVIWFKTRTEDELALLFF